MPDARGLRLLAWPGVGLRLVLLLLASCYLGGGGAALACPSACFCGNTTSSGAVLVDCSHRGLTSVPAGIDPSVADLRLNDNEITGVSEATFAGLAGLARLELGNNPLRSLPARLFAQLPALAWVSLNTCSLANLPPDLFALNSNLLDVGLGGNSLRELPPGLFANTTRLERLNLGANKLWRLDAGVLSALPRLTWVCVPPPSVLSLPACVLVNSLYLSAFPRQKPGHQQALAPGQRNLRRAQPPHQLGPRPQRPVRAPLLRLLALVPPRAPC